MNLINTKIYLPFYKPEKLEIEYMIKCLVFHKVIDLDKYTFRLILNILFDNKESLNELQSIIYNSFLTKWGMYSHYIEDSGYVETLFDRNYYIFNDYRLSDQQIRLNQFLKSSKKSEFNNFFISAPTSFGKTKLVLTHLIENYHNIVIIVPTKSLINEYISNTTAIISSDISEYKIQSSHLEDFDCTKKNIFICTPERYNLSSQFTFDVALIDEANNVKEISDNRSLELLFALKDLNIKRYYLAPYIKLDNLILYYDKFLNFGQDYMKCEFDDNDSLVTNKTYAVTKSQKDNNILEVNLMNKDFIDPERLKISVDINSMNLEKYKFSNQNKNIISSIVGIFKNFNIVKRKNLIYSGSKKQGYEISMYLAENFCINDNNDKSSKGLVQYFKDNYHEDYKQIKYIKSGVFCHNADMDPFARRFAERLYNETSSINTIVCTSTLSQGVNLSSEILYYCRKTKHETETDTRNIYGRAGRFKKSNVGIRFILNNSIDKKNSEEKLNNLVEFQVPRCDDAESKRILKDGRFTEQNKPRKIYKYYITEKENNKIVQQLTKLNVNGLEKLLYDTYEFETLTKIFEIYYNGNYNELNNVKFYATIFIDYLSGKSIKQLFEKAIASNLFINEKKDISYQKKPLFSQMTDYEKNEHKDIILDNIIENQNKYCDFKLKRVIKIILNLAVEVLLEKTNKSYKTELDKKMLNIDFDNLDNEKVLKIKKLYNLGVKDKFIVNEILNDEILYNDIFKEKGNEINNLKSFFSAKYGKDNYRITALSFK